MAFPCYFLFPKFSVNSAKALMVITSNIFFIIIIIFFGNLHALLVVCLMHFTFGFRIRHSFLPSGEKF